MFEMEKTFLISTLYPWNSSNILKYSTLFLPQPWSQQGAYQMGNVKLRVKGTIHSLGF